MRNKIYIALLIALVACCVGQVSASNRYVTITDNGGTPVFDPEPFGICNDGEYVTFDNQAGYLIQMKHPASATWRDLPDADTIQFPCTDDPLECYEYMVPSKSGTQVMSICAGTAVNEIPTLSEWGLIIFSLLILTMITVVVTRRRTASAAGGGADVTLNGPLFVPHVFVKTLTVTLGLAAVILTAATVLSSSVPLRDIAGTILSAGIVAYMAHLWFIGRND